MVVVLYWLAIKMSNDYRAILQYCTINVRHFTDLTLTFSRCESFDLTLDYVVHFCTIVVAVARYRRSIRGVESCR